MFPIFNKAEHKIHIISTDSRIEINEDKDSLNHTYFVNVRAAYPALTTLFRGTQVECESFLEELFQAMMHMKGAEVGELVERAKKSPEAA